MLYTTALTNKEWKVNYTKKRFIGKHPIECANVLYIYAETIEEAILIAKRELKSDTEITRCEVYK